MSWNHCWHKHFSNAFFYGMELIFLIALPLSLMRNNTFLLLIALFSVYFAYAGWRFAINKMGKAKTQDWFITVMMLLLCSAMITYGMVVYLDKENGNGITLSIFGVIGLINALRNYQSFRSGHFNGKKRIALHATMMLGGTIATVTAFVVTNFTSDPVYILWLAPAVVIAPYIVYWNIKLR